MTLRLSGIAASARSVYSAAEWRRLPVRTRQQWSIVRAARVNALIIGPAPTLDMVTMAIDRSFCRPISRCSVPGPLGWADVRGGTLILNDVAKLTRAQQEKLFEWSSNGVQILSLTPDDLFALVERGDFRADLYYRLNVVRIDFGTANIVAPGLVARSGAVARSAGVVHPAMPVDVVH